MRLRTGAILRATRPETIITSACRGLARKTSEPKRARSLRDEVAFIISMAQQARPNVAGHKEDLRAQLINESSRVVNTSGKASAMMFSSPIRNPLSTNYWVVSQVQLFACAKKFSKLGHYQLLRQRSASETFASPCLIERELRLQPHGARSRPNQ